MDKAARVRLLFGRLKYRTAFEVTKFPLRFLAVLIQDFWRFGGCWRRSRSKIAAGILESLPTARSSLPKRKLSNEPTPIVRGMFSWDKKVFKSDARLAFSTLYSVSSFPVKSLRYPVMFKSWSHDKVILTPVTKTVPVPSLLSVTEAPGGGSNLISAAVTIMFIGSLLQVTTDAFGVVRSTGYR